ncbi:hypothetical protein LSCM1_07704 [Leishmania martiniquensis]|uniref:Uncharacterized protein n=1 Tax=Leishmania martiniquensis TaxID=1580590 RepID=A0A836HMW6_9TRYP|nr:hypothetical protein LSCM1_07704 [Leishmania martiniquensis]
MESASASSAPKSSLCAELDALESTSLRHLSIDDALCVLDRLSEADAELHRCAGVVTPIADSGESAVPCRATGGAVPSAEASSVETLKQLRFTFAAQLTVTQQDVLMRVLYACMASCASGSALPRCEATCGASTGTHEAHEPLSPAAVRRLYEWHAALHAAAGDGAVVRALMSRS